MKTKHADQLDLFVWAETKPNNVIDAKAKFENRTMAFVIGMMNGHLPPVKDGMLIQAQFGRDIDRGAA